MRTYPRPIFYWVSDQSYFQNSWSSASKKWEHKLMSGVEQPFFVQIIEKYHYLYRVRQYESMLQRSQILQSHPIQIQVQVPKDGLGLWGTLFGCYCNVSKVWWRLLSAVPQHIFKILFRLTKRLPRLQVNAPHKGPVMRKAFPCHDIHMWKHRKIHTVHIWYQLGAVPRELLSITHTERPNTPDTLSVILYEFKGKRRLIYSIITRLSTIWWITKLTKYFVPSCCWARV